MGAPDRGPVFQIGAVQERGRVYRMQVEDLSICWLFYGHSPLAIEGLQSNRTPLVPVTSCFRVLFSASRNAASLGLRSIEFRPFTILEQVELQDLLDRRNGFV